MLGHHVPLTKCATHLANGIWWNSARLFLQRAQIQILK